MTLSIERGGVSSSHPLAALHERLEQLEKELAELKSREAAWQKREHELTDFIENAVVGLHKLGPDGTILWANEAGRALLGYTAEEYVGRNITELHAEPERVQPLMDRLRSGEAVREYAATLRCKDGSLRQVLLSSNGHFEEDRLVHTRCFAIDVTERRLVEAALREAHDHLAAIVESSEDAIITVDLAGCVSSWNRGAAILFRYSPEEILGRPIFGIIPVELHDEEHEIFRKVRDGERVEHYETVRMTKDGARLDISLTVSPVRDADGRLIGISKVGRDITDKKRAQRELTDAARRKDELLAILAHELRNPLAPIRYALSVSKQRNRTEDQRRHVEEVIDRQVEHMGRLLDDLLDVSRIARGHVELRKKWIELTSVVGAAIDTVRPHLDRKGHALALELPHETLRLEADPVRVTQILSNLLTNAAKYTDRGGSIRLRAWRDGDMVAFAVRDNGIGIPREMMPRLFTLFSQASTALQRSEGGLGIGLALVKGFVEMHGGTIEARSEGPGRGSEFIVRLPIGTAARPEPADRAFESAPHARRLRILVADDNPDSVETCALLLGLWGHDVRAAQGGRQALELAESFHPQVLLLDIGMPNMNGYEVAKAIREKPWARDATLIAVTGWGQQEDKLLAAGAGFDHHITKPLDPAELRPLLESLC